MDKRNFKIYRYFKEKRFVEDFLCGKLRLMPFKYYRDLEDKIRSDKFDGKSVFLIPILLQNLVDTEFLLIKIILLIE